MQGGSKGQEKKKRKASWSTYSGLLWNIFTRVQNLLEGQVDKDIGKETVRGPRFDKSPQGA